MDATAAPDILVLGDPRLRTRCDDVERVDERDLEQLAAALAGARSRLGFGRAIAAPQVGIARRIIVVDLGAGPFAVINPEITWRSDDTFELWDDCFSVPDRLVRVRRHCSISLAFRDGSLRRREWPRLPIELAELLQHEIDHLDGVLMVDRAIGDDATRPIELRGELAPPAPPHRLSLARIAEAARRIDPVFLHSPQFVCEPLAEAVGCRLTLKVETVNPIRSFKGRGADFAIATLVARGERAPLVCASAGNFGQGVAYSARKHGLPVTVFAAEGANPLKIARMRGLGAEVRIAGDDFEHAKRTARRWAAERGARFLEDGLEPEISEGAGSIAVELLARGDGFDAIAVPLGDGALLNGIARWVKAASPATRVIGVCSRGAPAMIRAWRRGPGAPPEPVDTDTIADGIAVRQPIAASLDDMRTTVDDIVEVDDAALIEAMRLVHAHAGLVTEPAGVAGLAAVIAQRAELAGRDVATVICGGNVTAEQLAAFAILPTG
jgi:threonine dehydratase/peptide deformylase